MAQGRPVAPPELGKRLRSDISGTLTRISHELSATAPDPSASAAFYGAFSGAFLAPIAPGA